MKRLFTLTLTLLLSMIVRGFRGYNSIRLRPVNLLRIRASSSDNLGGIQPAITGDGHAGSSVYIRGQNIKAVVTKFGPLGASVSVDEGKAFGLVLQREIALLREKRGSDILLGEEVDAYVEKVRDDGRLNVSFRPVDVSRMKDTADQVLEALEGSPLMSIPVGDKSTPEDVAAYFYGVTKSDFKKAVGMLYKQGIVRPGPFTTELIPEEDRKQPADESSKTSSPKTRSSGVEGAKAVTSAGAVPDWAKAVAVPSVDRNKKESASAAASREVKKIDNEKNTNTKISFDDERERSRVSLPEKLNSQRGDIKKTLFVGNLAISACTDQQLMAAFSTRIDPSRVKLPIRIAMDQEGKPRGFAYIEFLDERDVETALNSLKGLKIKERVVRLDFADPEAKAVRADESKGTVAELLSGKTSSSEPKHALSNSLLPPAKATLYVGNLSYKAGVPEITEFLEKTAGSGAVRSVRLASDPLTGRKKGFAFVDFYEEETAKLCFYELHEKDFLGRPVKIDDATRRE